MTQAPPNPHSPIPDFAQPPTGQPLAGGMAPYAYQRGPIDGPPQPYDPKLFSNLYLWGSICYGVGMVASIILIGIPVLIVGIVLNTILIYKVWNQIQDGHQRTSSGKAVGFLFIPFYNLYWIFVAYYGLSQDLNAYVRRYNIQAPPVNESLMMTMCVLMLCSIVPYLGLLAVLANLVIWFIVLYQVRTTAMAIAAAKIGGCPGCGYSRAGISPGSACPECGMGPAV